MQPENPNDRAPEEPPIERDDLVETRHGQLQIIPNDRPVSQALALYGEWAQAEIDAILPRVQPNGVFVDAGANIGVHTLAVARARPGVKIHAIEPHPQIAQILRANVASLSDRVTVHQFALGARSGTGFMPRLDTSVVGNAGATSLMNEGQDGADRIAVKTLDSLHLEDVTFLKLDIEGAEAAALSGAKQLIAKSRPVILSEVNTLQSALDVLAAMKPHGFSAFLMTTRAFNPGNFNGEVRNIFGYAAETALAFVPPGRIAPEASKLCRVDPVETVEDLARAFLAAPRFGDQSPIDRDAAALKAALQIERVAAKSRLDQRQSARDQQTQALLDHKSSELAALRASADQRAARHEEELAALTAKLAALTGEIERKNAQVDEARRIAGQHELALRSATLDLAARTNERDALSEQLTGIRDELEQQRKSSAQRVLELEEVTHRQLAATQEAEARLKSVQLKALASERSASDATAAKTSIERHLAPLKDGIRHLREAERKAKSAVTILHREKEAISNELVELRARHAVVTQFLQPEGLVELRKGLLGQATRRSGLLADAYREIKGSGFFDADWYAASYPDVAASGIDPIVHFVLFGGYEGRDPSERFSSRQYLDTYPDVRRSGVNPLLHYLRWGRRELRKIRRDEPLRPTGGQALTAPSFTQSAPPMAFFHGLPTPEKEIADVQVIIPVYRGYDETLACLASVLTARNVVKHEVVVIDDCSPEPELSAALDEIADLGLITLLKNEHNRGFVGTVNRGMTLSESRDVVLLNSDTLVFGDWLDRLRAHTRSGDRIATVTPFTNNGTICSFPNFCADNPVASGTRLERIDELAKKLHRARAMEIPTAVGFCMYIARAALREVGIFDEATFGRGYGEENDFCMRAAASGWKHLHALDTFVFHSGEASFGAEASEGKARGLRALQAKHAGYQEKIDRFIAADPAKPSRLALSIACRLDRVPQETVLCVSHTLGGGIARHIRDRKERLARESTELLVVQPSVPGTLLGALTVEGAPAEEKLLVDLGAGLADVAVALRQLGVRRIELHSTVGWSGKIVETVRQLVQQSGATLKVILHDYVFLCPQINLIDDTGRYCGEQGVAQCRQCLSKSNAQPLTVHPDFRAGLPDIAAWRGAYAQLLTAANEIAAPSSDTAARFRRYFPNLNIAVEPHPETLAHIRPLRGRPSSREPVRIATIGAIGPLKGSQTILKCALDAREHHKRLRFVVVGYSDIDDRLRSAGVDITGAYEELDLGGILEAAQPDVIFLPSVWPETYCYALSAAIATTLPICVFDLGAQAERLRSRPNTLILPLSMVDHPDAINDRLFEFSQRAALP